MKYVIECQFLGRKFRGKINGENKADAIRKLKQSLTIQSIEECVEPIKPIDDQFKRMLSWLYQ